MMSYIVGTLIGLVLGLTGAGGSVFAVPLLISLVLLSPQDAIGISLGAVGFSALFGVLTRLKTRQIQWLPAAVYSLVGGLFAPAGIFLNRNIPTTFLMLGFSLLVIAVAYRMWKQASMRPEEASELRSVMNQSLQEPGAICIANNNQPFKIGLKCVLGMTAGAALTGLLSGLFGVGGGFLIVPTLLFLTGISIRQAVATSLVIISFVSLSGFFSVMFSGHPIDFALLTQVALGGMVGMAIGLIIGRFIAGPNLQKVFSILMLLMAIFTLVTTLIN